MRASRRHHRLILEAIAQRAAEMSRLATQWENEAWRGWKRSAEMGIRLERRQPVKPRAHSRPHDTGDVRVGATRTRVGPTFVVTSPIF
jgi:hypothetical protein